MTNKLKAVSALLLAVIFWSIMVVVSRSVVGKIRPFSVNYYRLFIASVAFLPFFIQRKPWRSNKFPKLLAVSLFTMINFTFFMQGIQYTSASASQLIYSFTPVMIMVISALFFREKFLLRKIIGVLIGLLGIAFIIYLSSLEQGTTISGSIKGNLLIMVAMIGWLFYILLTKNLSKEFSPEAISSTSILVAFVLTIPLYLIENHYFSSQPVLTPKDLGELFFLGFFGTFLTYLLHQYALRHLSALTTSLSSYIQPITTSIIEILLLGVSLTSGFIVGTSMVFTG